MSTARQPKEQDADHPDEWAPGLRISFETVSVKTVKRATTPAEVVAVCLRHNLRRNNADHRHRRPIDPARTVHNTVLVGPTCPEAAAAQAADVMAGLSVVMPGRVDAVAGFELVIQPPPSHDTPAFWSECVAWVLARYEHVISAVVHRDQKRPHAHLLALPVQGGRYAGSVMQRGGNGFPKQRKAFLAHMLKELGIKHEHRKVKTLADLAISAGRGPKTRAAATRRDLALMRSTGASWSGSALRVDVARGCSEPTAPTSTPPTSSNAQPFHVPDPLEKVRRLWSQCFALAEQAAAPIAPCPPPRSMHATACQPPRSLVAFDPPAAMPATTTTQPRTRLARLLIARTAQQPHGRQPGYAEARARPGWPAC